MLFARLDIVANPEIGIAHLKYKQSRNINPNADGGGVSHFLEKSVTKV